MDTLSLWHEESEQGILGAVLHDNANLRRILPFERAWFFSERHRMIFEAMLALHAKGDPIDMSSVNAWLKSQGRGDPVCIDESLSWALFRAAAPTALSFHVDSVRRLAASRSALDTLRQAAEAITRSSHDRDRLAGALSYATSRWHEALAPLMIQEREGVGPRPLAAVFEEMREDRRNYHGTASALGVSVAGLADLGDLPVGAPFVIAAITRHGKTAFLDFLIRHLAGAGVRCHRFDLEDPSRRTAERFLVQSLGSRHYGATHLQVRELRRLISREWDNIDAAEAWRRADDCMAELAQLPISVDDSPGLSADDIRLRMRLIADEELDAAEERPLFFGVDHVLEVDHPGRDERIEINRILRTLRDGCRGVNAALALLAQLRRLEPVRGDAKLNEVMKRRPTLRDLQETGGWEQISRLTWALFRPEAEVAWGRRLNWTHPLEVENLKATDDGQGDRVYLMFEPTGTVLRPPTTVEVEAIAESRQHNRWFHEVWDDLSEYRRAKHNTELFRMGETAPPANGHDNGEPIPF